jgi:3-hydroxybutyryl-CoA dehydrogenase
MGPLRLLDLIGLDTHRHATDAAYEQTRDVNFAPPPVLERLVQAGRLGRKTGAGIYEYD